MQSATSSFNGVRIASSARGAGFAKRLSGSFVSFFLFAIFFFCLFVRRKRKKSVGLHTPVNFFARAWRRGIFFCFRNSRGTVIVVARASITFRRNHSFRWHVSVVWARALFASAFARAVYDIVPRRRRILRFWIKKDERDWLKMPSFSH